MAKLCFGCMKLKEKSPVCEHCGYNENIPNESHQLPIGTVLKEQYQVGKVLGQGGFGITYIGWDAMLETAVAIKEYYPSSYVNRNCEHSTLVACTGSNVADLFAQNRDRFLREARILAKLSHVPGIVRVQNLFGENNTAYIVMEYVEGINLKQYLRLQNRVMTAQEMLHVMRPILYALGKVHDGDLVHRDISPDNIMIQYDGSAKLLDFGAARQVENAGVNRDLTHSTQTILKHGFAPIEQYRSRGNLGPWTDIYALCATMYYCMTGKVPSEAPERVMGDDNVDWNLVPGLNEAQKAALEQGMAMLPEKRIGSVQELYEALYNRTATEGTVSRSQVRSESQPKPEPIPEPEPVITDYPVGTLPLEVEPEIPEVVKEETPVQKQEEEIPEPPIEDYPVGTLPLEVEPEIPEPKKEEPKEEPKSEPKQIIYPEHKPAVPVAEKKIRLPKKEYTKYIVIAILVLISLVALRLVSTPKNGWVEKKGKTYYYVDGEYQTGWQTIDGKKYYFSPIGVLGKVTGWQTIDNEKYYYDSDGAMKTRWQTIDDKKYYFDSDGVMQTGWQIIDGKKYYFSPIGVLGKVTGWQTIDNEKYYFDSDGAMKTRWQIIDGKRYYFDSDGAMKTRWQIINGKRYYFDSDGVMVTGTQTIGGNQFQFADDGHLID